ncbi:hypothetical protein PF001_g10577 [Phytophthora fragariae]|uniref:Uncharacterized protein n=1 Tax=Phytophthora fragariae TaxID=53985 RepID=A0A6A4DQM7_9STRA|nr:hypothetical protein PF001_g10577 [Phytophthora fragariae]
MPRVHSTGIAPAGALLSSMLPLGGSVNSGNAVCWRPLQLDAAVQCTCCQPWCLNTSQRRRPPSIHTAAALQATRARHDRRVLSSRQRRRKCGWRWKKHGRHSRCLACYLRMARGVLPPPPPPLELVAPRYSS